MRRLRLVRDIFLIFTVAFTLIMILTMITGAAYDNDMIWTALLIAAIYAGLSLMLFSERLSTRRGFLITQSIYVILLNVVYIVIIRLAGWSFSTKGYILNALYSIICFVGIRAIVFSLDKREADRINAMLQKHKRDRDAD